jgi:hypothetical protein
MQSSFSTMACLADRLLAGAMDTKDTLTLVTGGTGKI